MQRARYRVHLAHTSPVRLVNRINSRALRVGRISLFLSVCSRWKLEWKGNGKRRSVVGSALGPGKIYPLDVLTLDIFVFNQSGWPRRLEVTCPGERRGGKGREKERRSVVSGGLARKMGYPGVLAMDSQARMGK